MVGRGHKQLAEARAKRRMAEATIDRVWRDEARERLRRRVLEPLDEETRRIASAVIDLDQALARARALAPR